MMLKRVMVFVVGTCLTTAVQANEDMIKRGEYLSRIMDCTGCHTPGAMTGKPEPGKLLAGSTIGFGIPQVGVVYPPNLTPDTETGLGSWSEADIVTANDLVIVNGAITLDGTLNITDAGGFSRGVYRVEVTIHHNHRHVIEEPEALYFTIFDPDDETNNGYRQRPSVIRPSLHWESSTLTVGEHEKGSR